MIVLPGQLLCIENRIDDDDGQHAWSRSEVKSEDKKTIELQQEVVLKMRLQ